MIRMENRAGRRMCSTLQNWLYAIQCMVMYGMVIMVMMVNGHDGHVLYGQDGHECYGHNGHILYGRPCVSG